MIEANSVNVPADPHATQNEIYSADEETIYVPYREAVGSFMSLASLTRTDIALTVNVVSRYINNYKHCHWLAVKKYLNTC